MPPPDGTGTVFVRHLRNDDYTAIWQGDGADHHRYADITGSRAEVLDWVVRCRPATFLALDRSREDYVPFTVVNGTPRNLPL